MYMIVLNTWTDEKMVFNRCETEPDLEPGEQNRKKAI